MDHQENPTFTAKRNLRRKLGQKLQEQQDEQEQKQSHRNGLFLEPDAHPDLSAEIRDYVRALEMNFSFSELNRAAAKRATHALRDFAEDEDMVDFIVECGAIPALVKHLQSPLLPNDVDGGPVPFEHEVEKGSASVLGLLAVKSENINLIVDAGALSHLVALLKRRNSGYNARAVNGLIRRAADVITVLAHENSRIRTLVRIEGGIPPLVELLEFFDAKVQRAAAGALRILAFENDENKNQIMECNALPTLILMLQYEDTTIHCEAVGVIGNLVYSSPNIKKEVLLAGALQPIIQVLRSPCSKSQRKATLLLSEFADADSDCRAHIAQRGALRPLIEMLQSPDEHLKELSAFTLGRLALDTHNQAGIAYEGGIPALLMFIDSEHEWLKHNVAFVLNCMADNEDNVADLIQAGAVQKLQDGEFTQEVTNDCVAITMKRLEKKIHGRVLNHLLYLMRVSEETIQKHVALALAHLCTPGNMKTIFIDNNGIDLLLGLLQSSSLKPRRDASLALHTLATKAASLSPVDGAPASPRPLVFFGEQYVNNPALADVTFLVEGKPFYAHRNCLLASSDAFRAMFDGGYRESNAKDIVIPNIRWDVFEEMMRFIYTGSIDVNLHIAQDILRAADQYLVDGLKRLCEYAIAQDISVESVFLIYELSEACNASSLKQACIIFILAQYDQLSPKPWYTRFIRHIIPEIRRAFVDALTTPIQNDLQHS